MSLHRLAPAMVSMFLVTGCAAGIEDPVTGTAGGKFGGSSAAGGNASAWTGGAVAAGGASPSVYGSGAGGSGGTSGTFVAGIAGSTGSTSGMGGANAGGRGGANAGGLGGVNASGRGGANAGGLGGVNAGGRGGVNASGRGGANASGRGGLTTDAGSLPDAPVQPGCTPPATFWDESNLPAAKNVMIFKFLNRTNCRFKDSQIFWSFQQNGIKEIHSLAEQPTYDMPVSSSGRMYFYIVTDPPDPPASATDPTKSNYYDFIEHTIGAAVYNGNTTRVDRWGLKIAMKLNAENGTDIVGEDLETFQESREETFAKFVAEVPEEFKGHARPPYAPYGIPEMGGTPEFKKGGIYEHYMDSWIQELFASNGISGAAEVINCNPIAQPDLSAACYRHVGAGALTADGKVKPGNPLWASDATHYPKAPANYYAKFWHDHAYHHKAYGFPYDDVGGYSSFVSRPNPKSLIIAIGF